MQQSRVRHLKKLDKDAHSFGKPLQVLTLVVLELWYVHASDESDRGYLAERREPVGKLKHRMDLSQVSFCSVVLTLANWYSTEGGDG